MDVSSRQVVPQARFLGERQAPGNKLKAFP